MTSIFTPAVTLMSRLSYPRKFMLVGLLMLLPLLYVMTQYIGSINSLVEFAAKEQSGLTYNAPVMDFLGSLQNHATLSVLYLNDDTSVEEGITEAQAQIADYIRTIDEIDAELGATLNVTERWEALKRGWEDLLDDLDHLTPQQSIERHQELIEQTLA